MSPKRRPTPAVLILGVLCGVAPFATAASLLAPTALLYRTDTAPLSDADVTRWLAHAEQNDAAIREVNAFRVHEIHGIYQGAEAVSAADDILAGQFLIPDQGEARVHWPFEPDDLLQGGPSMQQHLAGLVVSDVLLEAYDHTGRRRYLDAAMERVRAFLAYEGGTWLPTGMLFNDHAIAVRSTLYARLLVALAAESEVARDDVQLLLGAIDRAVRLSARPRLFTYWTNHGLMQSLAVLHAAVVAPDLPGLDDALEAVIERTDRQMQYLISPDGIVTEHAPGYQEFNIALVAALLRYMSLIDVPIPEHWATRYAGAEAFYRHFRRPDGSLPRYGDTRRTPKRVLGAARPSTEDAYTLSEIRPLEIREPLLFSEEFGFWSEWRDETHVTVGWPNFVAGAHRRASELSVVFWWAGEEWWSGVGYWPWGHEHWTAATGWGGGNAPHVVGEANGTRPQSRIDAWTSDAELGVLQLERPLPAGGSVHRVVVRLGRTDWIVLDRMDDNGGVMESVWQTVSTVRAEGGSEATGAFRLTSTRSEEQLDAQALLGDGASAEWLAGSLDPFAGWTSEAGEVREQPALVLRAPAGSWTGVAWSTEADVAGSQELVSSVRWDSLDRWSVVVSRSGEDIEVARDGDAVTLVGGLREAEETGQGARTLVTGRSSGEMAAAEGAFLAMQESVRRPPRFFPVRLRIAKLGLLAGALQAVVLLLFVVGPGSRARWAAPALSTLVLVHVAFGLWLHWVYLA